MKKQSAIMTSFNVKCQQIIIKQGTLFIINFLLSFTIDSLNIELTRDKGKLETSVSYKFYESRNSQLSHENVIIEFVSSWACHDMI